MEHQTIHQLSAPKGEFLDPPQSSKPIIASIYEICPSFIAMVQEQTFSGIDYENPYHHLREFEQLYACLTFQACHKTHFGGNCFLSPLMRGKNNGTPIT